MISAYLIHPLVTMVLLFGLSFVVAAASEGNLSKTDFSTTNSTEHTLDNAINITDLVVRDDALTLPKQWMTFCNASDSAGIPDATNMPALQIDCHIGQNGKLVGFDTLRTWISNFSRTVSVSVKCDPGGAMGLPWPMKAHNLVSLKVIGCDILGFSYEFSNMKVANIPDELKNLSFIDVTVRFNIMELFNMMDYYENGSEEANCGQETMEKFIYRNVSYKFDRPPAMAQFITTLPTIENFWIKVLTKLMELSDRARMQMHRRVCNYSHLVYLDTSVRHGTTDYHFRPLVENAMFPKVKFYNTSHVHLVFMPKYLHKWRLYFPRLEYVDISHNNISELPCFNDYTFFYDLNTGYVDLRFNNISLITKADLDCFVFPSPVVDLRDNPLNCDCDLLDFYALLKNSTDGKLFLGGKNYTYMLHLKCASPVKLEGRYIRELIPEDFGCDPIVALIGPVVGLSILVVLLLLIIILVTRFRYEIRIIAFTRLNIIIPCTSEKSIGEKKYDAFISYSSGDEGWVMRTLAKRLENNSTGISFKLCLHHRDFEIGAAITENIAKSVEASRHTILVLSSNFLKSEWCLYEFRTAFHQSLIEKKCHLIIVVLEEVSTNEVEADLRRCLQTLTYVSVNDRWFWDKLVYTLSDKSKRQKLKSGSTSQKTIYNPINTTASE